MMAQRGQRLNDEERDRLNRLIDSRVDSERNRPSIREIARLASVAKKTVEIHISLRRKI